MKKMVMSVEKVTPAKALEYLATVDTTKQRPLKQPKVDNYAAAMAHGHWVVTHQGIAFDDDGNLCDGQHRLHAVVKSGVTIETQVTRNVAQKHGELFTFDAIDQGVKRHIGEQLHVRHGIKQANIVASAARKIVQMCKRGKNPNMSVANTVAVLGYYGKEINVCIPMLSVTKGMTRAGILGPAAFALRAGGGPVRAFVEAVGNGENLKKGDPALAFRQHALNAPPLGGGGLNRIELAFCLCAMHAVLGSSVRVVKTTYRGVDFFSDKQPRVVKAICNLFSV